jgi:hypothetical protein
MSILIVAEVIRLGGRAKTSETLASSAVQNKGESTHVPVPTGRQHGCGNRTGVLLCNRDDSHCELPVHAASLNSGGKHRVDKLKSTKITGERGHNHGLS